MKDRPGLLRHTSEWNPNFEPTWVAFPIGGKGLAQAWTSLEEYLKFCKALESRLFSRLGGIFKNRDKSVAA
ncbi:hypothetical protein MGN70_004564 [Eutypa lata]|nr:hypothetical protein MGN70_004564 [Eutypa lata]